MSDEFAEVLRRMRADADPRLSMTLAAAFDAGWTWSALGRLLGVSRQAVEQRAIGADFYPDSALPAIPPPPQKPGPPPKVPRKRLTVKPEVADRLRELHEVAKTVNGITPVDDPARRASEELSETLAALIERGVTAYHLAQVLGCTQGGISQRLARHGFPAAPGYVRQAYPYKNTTTWPKEAIGALPPKWQGEEYLSRHPEERPAESTKDEERSEEKKWCNCESYDCSGACCGEGNCSCTPGFLLDQLGGSDVG